MSSRVVRCLPLSWNLISAMTSTAGSAYGNRNTSPIAALRSSTRQTFDVVCEYSRALNYFLRLSKQMLLSP